jgi:hypothetical protein
VLDAASRTIVNVDAVPGGGSDRITITGSITYAGTLETPTYWGAGTSSCGEIRSVIIVGKTATRSGAFATLDVGMAPLTRSWRINSTATAVQLVGYSPVGVVDHVIDPIAVTEGGASGSVHVCLGGGALGPNVVVTPVSRRGQVTFSPSTLTFTSTNSMLPQRLTIRALDDALGEGAHADSVSFTATGDVPPNTGGPPAAIRYIPIAVTDNDPGADLTVSVVSMPATVIMGQNFEVRFRVTNLGPNASTGSTFTIRPMNGFVYSHGGGGGVTCAQSGTVLTCTVGALASGAQVEFSPVFTPLAVGTFANTVLVQGADYDHVPINSWFDWVVTIN